MPASLRACRPPRTERPDVPFFFPKCGDAPLGTIAPGNVSPSPNFVRPFPKCVPNLTRFYSPSIPWFRPSQRSNMVTVPERFPSSPPAQLCLALRRGPPARWDSFFFLGTNPRGGGAGFFPPFRSKCPLSTSFLAGKARTRTNRTCTPLFFSPKPHFMFWASPPGIHPPSDGSPLPPPHRPPNLVEKGSVPLWS